MQARSSAVEITIAAPKSERMLPRFWAVHRSTSLLPAFWGPGRYIRCALTGCDKSWAPGGPRNCFRTERGQWGCHSWSFPKVYNQAATLLLIRAGLSKSTMVGSVT
jgi:hypothetical protein